jgi:hypothetical protein
MIPKTLIHALICGGVGLSAEATTAPPMVAPLTAVTTASISFDPIMTFCLSIDIPLRNVRTPVKNSANSRQIACGWPSSCAAANWPIALAGPSRVSGRPMPVATSAEVRHTRQELHTLGMHLTEGVRFLVAAAGERAQEVYIEWRTGGV